MRPPAEPPWTTITAGAAPPFGPTNWRPCYAARCPGAPTSWASRGRTGPSPSCRRTCGAAAAGGCPTTPSAAGSTGWTTRGSASATPCRPTPSARKKRAIRRRLNGLPPRSVLLAEDETDLRLFPPLHAGWARRGQPAPVTISGANAKRVLFGSINVRTGHRLFLSRRHGRGSDCEAFLDEVHEH